MRSSSCCSSTRWRWPSSWLLGLLLLVLLVGPLPSDAFHVSLLPSHRSFRPKSQPLRAALSDRSSTDTIAGLAAQVRKAARAGSSSSSSSSSHHHEALRALTKRLAGALTHTPRKTSLTDSQHHHHHATSPLRVETRRLVLAAVGDCARANADPGPEFWSALAAWLHPISTLPTGELAALALALATLDVPSAATPLWESVVSAAARRTKGVISVREAGQLRKALTLLLGPGGGFRVGPQPTLAWLLPLLRAREGRLAGDGGIAEEEEEGPSALPGKGRRQKGRVRRPPSAAAATATNTAAAATTTYSALHRRLMALLQEMGCAVEVETAYQGLNLDIVLRPPPHTPSLRPLVIEVDGPQHFLQKDPRRPTGATAARRRLLRAATDAFAGLVSITYADEDGIAAGEEEEKVRASSSSFPLSARGRLLALLEREARAQAAVSLAAYRIGSTQEQEQHQEQHQEQQWALARRLCLAATPEALVAELRRCEAEAPAGMDAAVWAVVVGRMAGFLRHGHRFHGKSETATAARKRWLVDAEGRGVLWSEEQALALLEAASFPALATLLGALVDYCADGDEVAEAVARVAVARVDALLSSEEGGAAGAAATATPLVLVTLLRALAALGYRPRYRPLPSSALTTTAAAAAVGRLHRLLPLLTAQATVDRFDAHGAASLLHSLALLLLLENTDEPAAASCFIALFSAAERRLPTARRADLVLLAQGLAVLRHRQQQHSSTSISPPESFTTTLVAAAGQVAQSLPLIPALALLTLREPAAAAGARGEKDGDLMSQRARRRSPQWALVGEVRSRLRALSPSALVQTLEDLDEAKGGDYLPPPRAFLVMLCSELYKRRDQLSSRERVRVAVVLREGTRLGRVYDPGSRFWQQLK